jgi:hypothetical protein
MRAFFPLDQGLGVPPMTWEDANRDADRQMQCLRSGSACANAMPAQAGLEDREVPLVFADMKASADARADASTDAVLVDRGGVSADAVSKVSWWPKLW